MSAVEEKGSSDSSYLNELGSVNPEGAVEADQNQHQPSTSKDIVSPEDYQWRNTKPTIQRQLDMFKADLEQAAAPLENLQATMNYLVSRLKNVEQITDQLSNQLEDLKQVTDDLENLNQRVNELDDELKNLPSTAPQTNPQNSLKEQVNKLKKEYEQSTDQSESLKQRANKLGNQLVIETAWLIDKQLGKKLGVKDFWSTVSGLIQLMNEQRDEMEKTLENHEKFEDFLKEEWELLRRSEVNEALRDKIIESCRENRQKILDKLQEEQVFFLQSQRKINKLRSEVQKLANHPPHWPLQSSWKRLVKPLTLGFWGVLLIAVDAGPAAIFVVGQVGAAVSGAMGSGLIGEAIVADKLPQNTEVLSDKKGAAIRPTRRGS